MAQPLQTARFRLADAIHNDRAKREFGVMQRVICIAEQKSLRQSPQKFRIFQFPPPPGLRMIPETVHGSSPRLTTDRGLDD